MQIYITTNAPDVAKRLDELIPYIKQHQIELFGELGEAFVANVRRRIQTQDGGTWAEVSKWVRAKKGVDVPLKNADRFVHWRADGAKGEVYAETDGNWTLSMHHKGFDNKNSDMDTDGRIEIDIIDPSPLGLSTAGKFSWVAKSAPARTPARKVWPDDREINAITLPIGSKWLERVVTEGLNAR
jgi:hypothetical protein